MKILILPPLFLLLISSISFAQEPEKLPSKIKSPTEVKPLANPTSQKRLDMSDLVNLTEQKAPDFIAMDLGGNEYNLENLNGKIVVINLWST